MKDSSRRKFIQSSVLGAAAIGSGIPLAVSAKQRAAESPLPAGRKNPPLKVGLMTYNLGRDWDIETIIKNCGETGFAHVELRTTHKHGVEVSLSKRERAEVKKRFEDSHFEAISLASAFRYHWPDQAKLREEIEGTKEYLKLAADVGAIGIRVFPNQFVEGVPREKTLEQIGKSLAEVGEFGHNLGVDVRVCVHGKGTDDVVVIREILDYSGSDHVYVNWNCTEKDTAGKGLAHNFNLIKDKIRGVHMHDLTEDYPYREFLGLLREQDPTVYCNAEISASPEPIRLMHYYRTLFLAYQDEV